MEAGTYILIPETWKGVFLSLLQSEVDADSREAGTTVSREVIEFANECERIIPLLNQAIEIEVLKRLPKESELQYMLIVAAAPDHYFKYNRDDIIINKLNDSNQ